MSTCVHCATPFSASSELEKFCCRGCAYVHDLIHDEGLDRFYDLRSSSTIRPVRSLPFEERDFEWLKEEITKTEATAPEGAEVRAEFSMEGISCVGCVWLIEKIFLKHEGAIEAAAHPATGQLQLKWVSGKTDLCGFANEIAGYGYMLLKHHGSGKRSETRELGVKLGLCAAFMMNAMVFTLPSYVGMPDDFAFAGIFKLVTFLSATLSMMVGGSYFIKRAWHAVRVGTVHIDLPIALGISFAFAGSIYGWATQSEGLLYFDFVSTFIFLMLSGRYLQLSAIEKNRNRLQRRRPVPDQVISPDHDQPVSLSEIKAGLRIEIRPGQSVPVASVLETEVGEFSLEWINGEAEPVTFRAGRPLPAGAIHLGTTPIIAVASETWDQSLLSRLTDSTRPGSRVPALEKLLKFYLLAVILCGLASFIFWFESAGLTQALQVMISIFVVSCPCALGVAIPLADELAGSQMERAGVFIRESLLWSRLRHIKKIVFDKTGTLTLERPVLENPGSIQQLDPQSQLALAHLSNGSLHPVSRSLFEALGKTGLDLIQQTADPEIHEVPGMGRYLEMGGVVWALGRPGWRSGNIDSESPHDAELTRDGVSMARFHFSESLRPDTVATFSKLRKGYFRLVILSGDKSEKVEAVADALGVAREDAHATLQPGQKEEMVRQLDAHDTLYLGDGANDSLAFNASFVTGTPVVDRSLLEQKSDFFFLSHGLGFLPNMLGLAQRRHRTISVAFAFALIYNASAITAAWFGYMNPLVATIIMPLSSVVSLSIVAFGLKERT